jgi:hypothetical protein
MVEHAVECTVGRMIGHPVHNHVDVINGGWIHTVGHMVGHPVHNHTHRCLQTGTFVATYVVSKRPVSTCGLMTMQLLAPPTFSQCMTTSSVEWMLKKSSRFPNTCESSRVSPCRTSLSCTWCMNVWPWCRGCVCDRQGVWA